MGLAQGTHRKALGRLGCPQQRAIGGPLDAAALPHLFDGVGDRGGGNDAGPGQGRCAEGRATTLQQLWFDQTAGAIVNQDLLGVIRQGRQAQTYRILAGVAPHDPDHWCQRRSGR